MSYEDDIVTATTVTMVLKRVIRISYLMAGMKNPTVTYIEIEHDSLNTAINVACDTLRRSDKILSVHEILVDEMHKVEVVDT